MLDYSKRADESSVEFQYRVSKDKEIIGTWQRVADIINRELGWEYGESKYRKDYASFNKMFNANKTLLTDADTQIAQIDDKIWELKRQEKRFYDQRREYNKMVIAQARAEHLEEYLARAADNLSSICPFIKEAPHNYTEPNDNEGVIFFSDWHYGMVTNNIFNKYNVEICKRRVDEFLSKAIDRIVLNNVHVLHIVLLGDLANGAIHTTSRVAAEEAACEQLMHVSELVAESIHKLSLYVDSVKVYSTYGNHMRTIQNKKDSVHADNMERIIPWWLNQRFKDRSDIEIIDSEYYEFIKLKVCGYNILCTHGDLDNVRDIGNIMNTIFSRIYGEKIDYTVSADKHHIEQLDKLGIESAIAPALCGSDDYANEKRLYSNPAQTLMIFNRECGKDATYNIRLS